MFHVELHYPADWAGLPESQRSHLSKELTLRTGERLAYLMLVWHETASWFGDHTFVFDESPSAFTWDDVVSHVVGVRIADLALRDDRRPFDEAATLALQGVLQSLGAVGPEQTDRAIEAIDGQWWSNGKPLKRQLDIGLESGFVTPWLVSGPTFATNVRPERQSVPNLQKVLGRPMSDFASIWIEPRCAAAERMRAALPVARDWFSVDTDLPLIFQKMAGEMRKDGGEWVDVPFPRSAKTARPAHAIRTPDQSGRE
jgi:hypothetical protein